MLEHMRVGQPTDEADGQDRNSGARGQATSLRLRHLVRKLARNLLDDVDNVPAAVPKQGHGHQRAQAQMIRDRRGVVEAVQLEDTIRLREELTPQPGNGDKPPKTYTHVTYIIWDKLRILHPIT